MKKNMGQLDKVIRVLLAILIATLYLTNFIENGTLIGTILLVLAGVLILTSTISFCPLYLPFGISTKPKKHAPPPQHHHGNNHHHQHKH